MSDLNQIGSLLSRMTAETSSEYTFTKEQIAAVVEILIPKIVTELPGMPSGMTCQVSKKSKGWNISVGRP